MAQLFQTLFSKSNSSSDIYTKSYHLLLFLPKFSSLSQTSQETPHSPLFTRMARIKIFSKSLLFLYTPNYLYLDNYTNHPPITFWFHSNNIFPRRSNLIIQFQHKYSVLLFLLSPFTLVL